MPEEENHQLSETTKGSSAMVLSLLIASDSSL